MLLIGRRTALSQEVDEFLEQLAPTSQPESHRFRPRAARDRNRESG
jgi:hypothetical protein